MSDRYNKYLAKVPSNILHHQSTVKEDVVKNAIEVFGLHDPYCARITMPKKRVFFAKTDEVGVYMLFFVASLRFPLEANLVAGLRYYQLPLC